MSDTVTLAVWCAVMAAFVGLVAWTDPERTRRRRLRARERSRWWTRPPS